MAGKTWETVSVTVKKECVQGADAWDELIAYATKAKAAGFVPGYISVCSKDERGADQRFHFSSDHLEEEGDL